MPRKKPEPVRAELLPPATQADLEPWFQSREVTLEIKRRQTVTEQRKWSSYYFDWGCLVCGTQDRPHHSNGMCQPCYSRVRARLAASIRKHSPATPREDLSFVDSVRLAREAIAPALHVLTASTMNPKRRRSRRLRPPQTGLARGADENGETERCS